jgi:hypothetical protein
MKAKTSELTGVALDWLVAKCEGVNQEAFCLFYRPTEPNDYDVHGFPEFHYSTLWHQGGPIIEREKISINYDASGRWSQGWRAFSNSAPIMLGETPLIAAMRCFVASELGDEIEVPDELGDWFDDD